MRDKKIVMTGDIDDKTLANFTTVFKEFDAKPCNLQVMICSGGGEVDAGCGMYELMRSSNNPLTTFGYGLVGSMAVLLFEAGDLRVATEGTTFLLHDGSVRASGTLLDVKIHLEEMLRNHNWYADQIAHRCKLPFKKVLELTQKETYLTAQEALNLKLVDEIVPYRHFAKLTKRKK
jgi:ATP-dependent protease ClpP protease subunit